MLFKINVSFNEEIAFPKILVPPKYTKTIAEKIPNIDTNSE